MRNLFDPEIIAYAAGIDLDTPPVPTSKAGPKPSRDAKLAELIGVDKKKLVRNGLNRVQTVDSWLYRFKQVQRSERSVKNGNAL